MSERQLQREFSRAHPTAMFDATSRGGKARKAVAVMQDHRPDLGSMHLLEIGCSAGYGTVVYAEKFGRVTGIDIDEPAVAHAKRENARPNTKYLVMDAQRAEFPDGCFDAIACTHIYEHVPDASRLVHEIHRLLCPGGICFFSAGNRLCWNEPHYHLPLLSVLPRFVADRYLRLSGRGTSYYEHHLTYWGLRKLVSEFQLLDYTVKVVEDPVRFEATEVVRPGSLQQKLSRLALGLAYWASPTYLWLLKK
jgi:2-polyprenyl-3-methyl-5-hydroxy-6-metoxy-1,4-benzoquinol methylase